ILVPKSLDPVARGRKMPLPDARPSAKIAKLFPQVDPLKNQQKDQKDGAKGPEAAPVSSTAKDVSGTNDAATTAAAAPGAVAQAPVVQAPAAKAVPLPEARPEI